MFGFNDEGMKWAKFRHHYNKHLTWKTKHSTEEIDEEMTASLVNLPLSQPAPAPVLVQEDGVTLKDTESSRELLELGSESVNQRPALMGPSSSNGRAEVLINSEVQSVRMSQMNESAPELNIRVCHIIFLSNRLHFLGRQRHKRCYRSWYRVYSSAAGRRRKG